MLYDKRNYDSFDPIIQENIWQYSQTRIVDEVDFSAKYSLFDATPLEMLQEIFKIKVCLLAPNIDGKHAAASVQELFQPWFLQLLFKTLSGSRAFRGRMPSWK